MMTKDDLREKLIIPKGEQIRQYNRLLVAQEWVQLWELIFQQPAGWAEALSMEEMVYCAQLEQQIRPMVLASIDRALAPEQGVN